MEGYHVPVLLSEALDALNVEQGLWYLDCTLGDGGHTVKILERGGRVLGIDVDPQSLIRVSGRLQDLGIAKDRYQLIQGNFRDLRNLLYQQTDAKDLKIAGVIFDLGVSSLQLWDPARGFSFSKTGPLDMRMDPNLQIRAADLVNTLSRKELDALFNRLGEEKYSRRVADALVRAREVARINTTADLAEIVAKAVGKRGLKIHPATKVFQALRIVVNDELEALEEALAGAISVLNKGGVIVVISFHSLEDRIVKFAFRQWDKEGMGLVITKKPITPSLQEIGDNPRSRSAKMRVFKKL